LFVAISVALDKVEASYAQRKSENYDWDEYGREQRARSDWEDRDNYDRYGY
jgi:hypothetical protein